MNKINIALIRSAVIVNIKNLDKKLHILDDFNIEDDEYPVFFDIPVNHGSVVSRLEKIEHKLRLAESGQLENLQMEPEELFCIHKAVNDHIIELEHAIAYFHSMHKTENRVIQIQNKIESLFFVLGNLNHNQNNQKKS